MSSCVAPGNKVTATAPVCRALGPNGNCPTRDFPPAAAEVHPLEDNLFFAAIGPAMRAIRSQAQQVAKVDVPVLCLGESGTGKEVVARLIHQLSLRAGRTFMKVNCAALPAELLESELFGYEPGAFTGATRVKPGKFELCDRGTIFLDEIAEMPTSLQAKLLHVLQDQEFARLGGCSRVRVDVRIIAATNVDVQQAIAAGKLRDDLFYRLNAFVFHLPPLRDRREDLPVLLRHYVSHYADRYGLRALPVSERMLNAALEYPWPGNIRELENFAKRYLLLEDEALALRELRRHNDAAAARGAIYPADMKQLVQKLKNHVETQAIRSTLNRTNWNRKAAARQLRISYKAMLYKIERYGLNDPQVGVFGTPAD